MYFVMRSARVRWRPHELAASVLGLAIFTVACTGRDSGRQAVPAPPQSAVGSGGARESRGGEAGVVGGLDGAGGSGGDDAATPGIDEPDRDEPDREEPDREEPEVIGPDPDEPDREEPPVEQPPDRDGHEAEGDAIGLPCEVRALLASRCQSCPSDPPVDGAFIPLQTYADLTARSKTDPSVTVVARCVKRMKDSHRPMPPVPANPITISELTPLQAWLDAGSPRGACQQTPAADPYAASPTCTSGKYWTAIDSGSPWMNPGRACITCHRQYPSFAPLFTVAGTVFATAHEPDKCFGVPRETGAQVIITDAHGVEQPPIEVVSGGNFGAILSGLALPYRAKVVVGDKQRAMLTPQTNGDCNACHSQSGAQGARGRVMVP